MRTIGNLFFVLFCVHVLSLPLAAQTYVWKLGGADETLRAGGDFRGSHLENMGDIIGMNLDNANFEGSRFIDMLIENTSFRGANLRSVNASLLNGAMTGCDFTDADITGSFLFLNGEQLRSTKNYKNKNLADTTVGGDLSGVSFAGFNLTNAWLFGNFENCDFTDAIITNIVTTRMTLEQIKTTRNYKDKDLGGTIFIGVNFDNADFRNFKLGAFHRCSFENANFTDAEFAKIRIRDVRDRGNVYERRLGFVDCLLTQEQFESTRTYKSKDLSWMLLSQMNLDQWNFRDCNLEGAVLSRSSLADTDFTNARIPQTVFFYTNITTRQWLSTFTARNTRNFIPSTTSYVDLSNYDFSGKTITAANDLFFFSDVNLSNANFTDATLVNVQFSGADLSGTNFTNAKLDGVTFRDTPLTWEQFASTQNGQARDFSKITINGNNLEIRGWDFSNADLMGITWWPGSYPDCVFDNATINVSRFRVPLVPRIPGREGRSLTREQFMSTANYRSKVLHNADFYNSYLRGMDFSGFDLTGSSFRYADLTDARFDDAIIKGCGFSFSTSQPNTPLTKEQFYSTACYKSGVVERVRFSDMDLTDWDFSNVRLVFCSFVRCIGAPER